MLDTRFPRPRGDVGHPETFSWPVRHAVVPGAAPRSIVTDAASLRASTLIPAFVDALRGLHAAGARALTTSCGFLVLLQDELQAAVPVPLVTSSLLQLPGLLAREPQVGVLTIDAASLSHAHLRAAGVAPQRLGDVIVQGVHPSSEFAARILGNAPGMDLAQASRDVCAAACALRERAPHLRAAVLECTNMPPYADAVRAASGLEVFSLGDDPTLRAVFA